MTFLKKQPFESHNSFEKSQLIEKLQPFEKRHNLSEKSPLIWTNIFMSYLKIHDLYEEPQSCSKIINL